LKKKELWLLNFEYILNFTFVKSICMLVFLCLLYADPRDAPCEAGCLYTKHRQGEAEEWDLTSTAIITLSSETYFYIIGLAGSFVASDSGDLRINVDSGSNPYAGWHLTTDFLDAWDVESIRDYYTDYFPVMAGYRYRFRIITTVPLKTGRLYFYNIGSSMLQTCESSNFSCAEGVLTSVSTETGSGASAASRRWNYS
jgi:hypothetical protein